MATYRWRGVRFRIATALFSKAILNWNVPIRDPGDIYRNKAEIPREVCSALDAYVRANGFAGLTPMDYLDKLFDAEYWPK